MIGITRPLPLAGASDGPATLLSRVATWIAALALAPVAVAALVALLLLVRVPPVRRALARRSARQPMRS